VAQKRNKFDAKAIIPVEKYPKKYPDEEKYFVDDVITRLSFPLGFTFVTKCFFSLFLPLESLCRGEGIRGRFVVAGSLVYRPMESSYEVKLRTKKMYHAVEKAIVLNDKVFESTVESLGREEHMHLITLSTPMPRVTSLNLPTTTYQAAGSDFWAECMPLETFLGQQGANISKISVDSRKNAINAQQTQSR
jgi:hypothetical protein